MPKEIKKEIDEDTHLRRLFTFYLKQTEEELDFKLPNKDRAELIADLVEDFGAAVEAVVTCAIDAAFTTLMADDEEGEDEDGEDEEGEENEDGDEIDAEFESEEEADAA